MSGLGGSRHVTRARRRGAASQGYANRRGLDDRGGLADLGLFLDRVSKYARVINVDNLAISAAGGVPEKTINATFTATTFVYDEREQVVEEGAE